MKRTDIWITICEIVIRIHIFGFAFASNPSKYFVSFRNYMFRKSHSFEIANFYDTESHAHSVTSVSCIPSSGKM